jgi:hypothetical protein
VNVSNIGVGGNGGSSVAWPPRERLSVSHAGRRGDGVVWFLAGACVRGNGVCMRFLRLVGFPVLGGGLKCIWRRSRGPRR